MIHPRPKREADDAVEATLQRARTAMAAAERELARVHAILHEAHKRPHRSVSADRAGVERFLAEARTELEQWEARAVEAERATQRWDANVRRSLDAPDVDLAAEALTRAMDARATAHRHRLQGRIAAAHVALCESALDALGGAHSTDDAVVKR